MSAVFLFFPVRLSAGAAAGWRNPGSGFSDAIALLIPAGLAGEPCRNIYLITQEPDLLLCHFHIQCAVLLCGILPGDILGHITLYHLIPALALCEVYGLGSVDSIQQEAGLISVEGEAVAFVGVLIVGLYSILEAAGLADDRHGTVVHADQLCQSCGLCLHHT